MREESLSNVRRSRTPNKRRLSQSAESGAKVLSRQAPRSGALFFRPFLLGTAKEMDKRI